MKIAITYHMFPHYRSAVMSALQLSTTNTYTFLGSDVVHDGIKPMPKDLFLDFREAGFSIVRGIYWQPALIKFSLSNEFAGIIFLGNPNFASTWIAAVLARLSGKKVFFWTHGWLKPEGFLKKNFRNFFYSLAHEIFVYNERAKILGSKSGFPSKKVTVIYNSLDDKKARDIVQGIESGDLRGNLPGSLFDDKTLPIIVCSARITALCQFDILFKAAKILADNNKNINILLIGDGPERKNLEKLAAELKINVIFYGACYEESITGQLIYHSDLTVSPGKIGLTAMHSLMYGTPAITHSDFDQQMPEVEAIEEGSTGLFFIKNDEVDLAQKIDYWLSKKISRNVIRENCMAVIDNKWNSKNQVRIIESVINKNH